MTHNKPHLRVIGSAWLCESQTPDKARPIIHVVTAYGATIKQAYQDWLAYSKEKVRRA